MTYHQAMQACLDEHDSLRRANPNQVFIFYSSDKLVGAYAPDTIGQMISGELVDRNFFRNKITLFNFWFESCPGCVAEIPELNQLVEHFGKKDFNFVAIGRETDADVQSFMEKHAWQFDPLSNGHVAIEEVFRPIWGYPTTMVVNQEGRIAAMWRGIYAGNYDQLVEQLDSLQNRL